MGHVFYWRCGLPGQFSCGRINKKIKSQFWIIVSLKKKKKNRIQANQIPWIKITSKWSEIDIAGSAVLTEAICNDLTFLWWVWLEKSVKFNIKNNLKNFFFYVGGLPFESVVLSIAMNWTSLSLNCSINWGWANDSKNSKSKSNALVSNFLVSRPSRPYWCVIAREQKKNLISAATRPKLQQRW